MEQVTTKPVSRETLTRVSFELRGNAVKAMIRCIASRQPGQNRTKRYIQASKLIAKALNVDADYINSWEVMGVPDHLLQQVLQFCRKEGIQLWRHSFRPNSEIVTCWAMAELRDAA